MMSIPSFIVDAYNTFVKNELPFKKYPNSIYIYTDASKKLTSPNSGVAAVIMNKNDFDKRPIPALIKGNKRISYKKHKIPYTYDINEGEALAILLALEMISANKDPVVNTNQPEITLDTPSKYVIFSDSLTVIRLLDITLNPGCYMFSMKKTHHTSSLLYNIIASIVNYCERLQNKKITFCWIPSKGNKGNSVANYIAKNSKRGSFRDFREYC